jgi:hypothetical protein
MKNFPKINLVQDALHGMAYYIFLKSLRSLEEFRKNHHVKIPPKSPSTNFPSLGKFKIQFLFEKNSSSEFSPLGPAGLPTPPALACRTAQAIQPSPAQTAQPTRPLSRPARARLWRILQKMFSSSVHAFLSRPPPPRFSDNWAPAVSFVPHLQPPELARAATDSRSPSAAPLRASGALRPLPPRLHFPSLNSPP